MNTPVCPTCGNPLAPEMAQCPRCGHLLNTQQPSYGGWQGNPGPYGPPGQQPPMYGAVPPGGPAPTSRRPLVIAAILGALVLVAAVVAVVIILNTNGDDEPDPKTADPGTSDSSPTAESSTDPTDDLSASANPPAPPPTAPPTSDPATPTTPGKTLQRTPAVGSDEAQIRRLVRDTDTWIQSIFAGDSAQCDNMSDYFVSPSAESIKDCKQTLTQAGDSAEVDVSFEAGDVTVNGDTGTVALKKDFTIDGKTETDTSTEDVVKKDGLWYFVDD